jgi:hypothetical protein
VLGGRVRFEEKYDQPLDCYVDKAKDGIEGGKDEIQGPSIALCRVANWVLYILCMHVVVVDLNVARGMLHAVATAKPACC